MENLREKIRREEGKEAGEQAAGATVASQAEPERETAVQRSSDGAIPAKSPKSAAWPLLLPSHPYNGGPEDTGVPIPPGHE
jgi:hypothetical protein